MIAQRLYRDAVELYDAAFSWDVSDEIEWALEQLRVQGGPVLEPGCGTGRILEALARRGVSAVGIDESEEMVAFAQDRLDQWSDLVAVEQADMADFRLGRRFQGALCPVNTLAYLAPGAVSRHLLAMAAHLEPGTRYLVQLDLYARGEDPRGSSSWKAAAGDTEVEVSWSVETHDPARRSQRHRSRIVVIAGPQAGSVLDDVHDMTSWTPEEWQATVAASPFRYVSAHDGSDRARPEVPLGTSGELLWHVLELSPDG